MARDSYSAPAENGFPWRVLLATAIIWLMPVGVYAVYLQTSFELSGMTSVLALIAITAGIPIVALILHLVDKRRENGYISVWGYR